MCFIIGNRLSLELLPITSCLWVNNIALNPSNLTNMLWICCFQWQTCCEFVVSNLASSYFQLVMILFEAPLLSWCYQRHNKDPAKCLWWNFFCGNRGHPLSTYAKFSEKLTFLTSWYAHVRAFLTFTHLLFSQKSSIVDFWQGPKWASGSHLFGYMTYCVKISQRMRKIHRYNVTFINVINFFVPLRELWENSEVNFFSETCFKCVSQENCKARQLKNWPFVQENRE